MNLSLSKKQVGALVGAVTVAAGAYFGVPVGSSTAVSDDCSCAEISVRVGAVETQVSSLQATVDQVDGKVDQLLARALETHR